MQSSRQNKSPKKIEVIKRNLADINEKNSMLKKSTFHLNPQQTLLVGAVHQCSFNGQ
jgi:hypothetical protein